MKRKTIASSVPYHSFQSIIAKFQIKDDELLALHQHSHFFTGRSREFSEFFYNSFLDLPETRILLERLRKPDSVMHYWQKWFERVFTEKIDFNFVAYLWRIGLKHVEINLDQRFTNIGFSLVRQFIRRLTREKFPPDIALDILSVTDRIIDLCTLVETSAYIDASTHCDVEILKGIADKIRNPVTIIGGNLRRLQRKVDAGEPLFKEYDFLISYVGRCEDMVTDINTYVDIFQREPAFEKCMVDTIIDNVLENLSNSRRLEGVKVEVNIGPSAQFVWGDPVDLRQLFYHVIENAGEAAGKGQEPFVRISAMSQETPPHTIRVEVFNSGEAINLDNIANILTPFYSTKSHGSGLGLSIAKLVARKNFGDIAFEPVPQMGTKVYITLQQVE